MNRFLLSLIVALLALLLTAPAASAFNWKDVVKMHEAGIADSLILQKIEYSGTTFRLNAEEMEALKEAGVSDSVISAMLRTEAVEEVESDESYRSPYYYDDGYYGHPYSYPRARVYVGFGYYGPYPWYCDPYYVFPRYGRHGRVYYGDGYRSYPRYYDRRHRPYSGYYGRSGPEPTRYRSRVESRVGTHNRGVTGYRSRPSTGTPRIAPPRTGSSRSGGSGPSPTRVRGR